ncbi:DUF805 domain-containing protein [Luteolibacter luteus]|uniref:DUF805 domain-containing protein n=1 Tax=Luteolibacter luteus TaxID=2728835 RepID=A0A858RBT7_9BACT|nr:DUF805 domain-containing protein [Luteolibacter luteus]QJE94476.1 DUF805 domain-containing protein [Luteolibacter luteus]
MTETDPYQPPKAQPLLPRKPPRRLAVGKVLFSFKGRIPRSTYLIWSFPSNALIGYLLEKLVSLERTVPVAPRNSALPAAPVPDEIPLDPAMITALWLLLAYVPLLWIRLALLAKRWHDKDRSANWLILAFIPLIGDVINFIECGCQRGTRGPNQYGPDSLGEDENEKSLPKEGVPAGKPITRPPLRRPKP